MKRIYKAAMASVLVIIVLIVTMPEAKAEQFDVKAFLNNIHVRVGVAHKITETSMHYNGVRLRKKLTARIGVWHRFNEVFSKHCYVDLGVDHHSQYLEGWPINNRNEYVKTEFFLDGTCTLGGLL